MKTIADAHRIARLHRGRLKELFGAEIQLAPSPQDIVRRHGRALLTKSGLEEHQNGAGKAKVE